MSDTDSNTIIKKFRSATAFLEWATHAPCFWEGDLVSRDEGDVNWYKTANYNEAYKLAKYGWPEGLEELTREVKVAQKIVPEIMQRKKRYDVAGHYPNPGRAAAGEPFAMVHKGNIFKQKPVLSIRHNFQYVSSKSASEIIKWGAAVCSYTDLLEQQGQSIQLDAVFESSPSNGPSGGPNVSFQFPLKRAEQHLSLASLVFWWAHPSALRRITLSAYERLDVQKYYDPGYGRPENVTQADRSNVLQLDFLHTSRSLEENLEIIRSKHQALMDKSAEAEADLSRLTYG